MKTLHHTNFLIIGVPKAGTTSLYHYLKAHPEIYMPETTELRYFNRNEMVDNLNGPGDKEQTQAIVESWDDYLSYFNNASNQKAVGECTTSYLYSEYVLEEIKSKLGNQVKLIVVLRNPVERAFSNYMHFVRSGREQLGFKVAIEAEEERRKAGWNNAWLNLGHSLYADKIKRLRDSGMSYKVILFEDLINKTQSTVQELYEWLGVDSNFVPKQLGFNFNKGGRYKQDGLINWLKKPSKLRSVVKTITPDFIQDLYRRKREQFIHDQTIEEQMEPEMQQYLHEYFKEDVEALSHLIDFDKSKWGY